jgi:hypothetical protein
MTILIATIYNLSIISFLLLVMGKQKLAVRIKLLFLLLFVLPAFHNSFAQLSQPARYEIEQKNSDSHFTLISMEKHGIALIRDKQKYEHGNKSWEVIFLDSALNESWKKDLAVDNQYHLIGHDYRDENIYFLFRMGETDQGKLKIIKVAIKDHQIKEHNYEPELVIKPTHFNILENQVIYAGYINNEPTVLLFNLDTDQAKLVPGLLVSNSELLDVRVNANNTFNVLISERQTKTKKKLIVKTFDKTGAMLLDDVIEIESERTILAGLTSTLVRDELIVIGTWGEGVIKQASGIFTVLVDPYSAQKITYYDFAQFSHFLDYLSPKRIAKTKEKSDRRRAIGKIPEFKTFVLPARLVETKEGFQFFSEVYYSSVNLNSSRWGPYSPYPYSPYGNYYPYRFYNQPYYGYPYNNYGNPTTNFSETKMLHASIIDFDAKGNLLADHGFKLEDIKTPSSEQISDFITQQNKTTILFSKEKEIHLQVSQKDGLSLINEKKDIQLKSANETIRGEDGTGSVRHWFDNCFYLFGYQTIKTTGEGSRDVFYINKLKIE